MAGIDLKMVFKAKANNLIWALFRQLKQTAIQKLITHHRRCINNLVRQGAGGAILGCTEIPMLIKQEDCTIPVFDTTYIHSQAAIEFSLKG